MIGRTVRSKHLISMTVIAVHLAAAYPPVVASQETKKEAELCRISSDTALPCPTPPPRKEIPETQAQQAANQEEQELWIRNALWKRGQFPESAPAGAGLLLKEQAFLVYDPGAIFGEGNGLAPRLFLRERFG